MVIRNIFFLFFFFLVSSSLYGQGSIYKKANKAFDTGEYYKARELYKKAYTRSNERKEKTEISFKMANCAMLMGDYKLAESYYKRTIKLRYIEMFGNPIVIFNLAEALKGQEKYDEAIEKFQEYSLKEGADQKMANEAIESCEMSKDWISSLSRYKVQNVQKLNSRYNDFSPAFGDKKNEILFFTSSREEAVGKAKNEQTNQDFSDIFVSILNEDKKKKKKKKDPKNHMPDWGGPTNGFDKDFDGETYGLEELNQKDSEEGVISFSKGAKKMYFTKAIYKKNQYNGRRIYSAEKRSNSFDEFTMEKIPIDTLVDVFDPAISQDGKTLYFASNMEGGEGGSDLYKCTYDRKKKGWGDPENLGPSINTDGNEGFPYLSKSGTLFFSSDGHIGMGGLDIFKVEVTVDGFSKPENLKYPINTPYDDFGIIFEDDEELRGYLSSNRKGKQWKARGGDDIYFIDKQLIFFEMSGFIMDTTINEPISGVNIQLTGTDGSMHSTITDGKGAFNIPSDKFKEGSEYQIQFKKDFYLTQRDTISTVNIDRLKCEELEDGNLVFKFERYVQMKSTRRPIILPEVQYDLGKATLREAGKKALDGLADLLTKDHPEIVIELRSHTDVRGSKQLNKKLSEERAQSCVDYLVEQGVSPDRLIPVGRSYYEPFEDEQGNKFTSKYISQLPINLQESAHQKNRRTDFKVLSTNLEDYNKEIENKERPIQDAIIDEEGNLIEITD